VYIILNKALINIDFLALNAPAKTISNLGAIALAREASTTLILWRSMSDAGIKPRIGMTIKLSSYTK
jgi:hypothetical protein